MPSVPPHLAAKGWHTPTERNYQPMPMQAVQLDTLPTRTRALSADNAAIAADILGVLVDEDGDATGAGASDGVAYPDRKAATKVGDHARRTFLRSKPKLPAGQVVRARYDNIESEWRWTIYLTAATPAKPTK